MNRPTFETGLTHQKATATWVRRRLADRQGGCFLYDGDQSGVLLADGVGMGKTWEALAATVLILNGMQLKKRKGSVLIICPPNLVTKWEDELSTGSPFRDRLKKWVEDRQTLTARQIEKTLDCVVPVRRSRHVQTREKYGKSRAESGTYIVSHGLLRRSGDGLSALRQHTWDVIIVDEAHHLAARNALKELVKVNNGCRYKLLLSATPFQLEPKEWSHLAGLIVEGRTTILGRPEIKAYLNAIAARFEDSEAPGPRPIQVQAAQEVLKRIAARTLAAKSPRTYWVLLPDGSQKPIDRIDRLDDKAVQCVFAYIEESYRRTINNHDFECAYLKYRYYLAARGDRTFVATKLRQFLAKGEPGAPSPRLVALREWAKRTWVLDLKATLKDGFPRKTIVFTSWVGQVHGGEAEVLKKELSAAFEDALQAVRTQYPQKWEVWRSKGEESIRSLDSKLRIPEIDKADAWIKQRLPIILDRIANDELNAVIAGSRDGFRRRLRKQIQQQLNAIEAAWRDYATSESKNSVEGRGAKRRLNDALGALERWGDKHGLGSVERYTGNENRITRDRAAAGFREVTQPWVLVASNVGAEGIDLQTYTRRIIHYDLEWNPARMEQREGRGDRVGRLLKEELSIIYCLVPRTYDERMFHQLVARDRWHGVLLGKAGARLVADEGMPVRIETAKFIKKARLNLSPR
jgi:superfamily II DNA or RNA helicase